MLTPQESPVTYPTHRFAVWSKLIVGFIVLATSSSQAVTPELLVLQQQYTKVLNDRVTTVFEINLAQLTAHYLEAVERNMATVRAAGDLNEVLALEIEKNLIIDRKPIPEDDADTKPSVKKLRAVYHGQLSKLEGQRATDHAAILGPYVAKLKALEVELTKMNRVADAKEVMDYRTSLGEPGTSVAFDISSKDVITNSLGMKFIPVKGTTVYFCIHETRRQDYAAFAAEESPKNGDWKHWNKEGVPAGHEDDHPAVQISWENAKNFCAWLSKKEGKSYRLPTDKEWSYAAGNGNSEKWTTRATPESLNSKVPGYYWGKKYPPKSGDLVGNFGDKKLAARLPNTPFVEGYDDGFESTSPVMSFKPNRAGLYDMEGNVMEWIEDWWKLEISQRGGFNHLPT